MNKEDLLNKYFEKSLNEEESAFFYQLIESDLEFKSEFEYRNQVKKAIALNEREKLREKLKSFESKPRRVNSLWYAAAASLVIVFSFYFILFNQNHTSEELYNEYFEVYPNVVQPIVRGDGNSLVNEAFVAYENENYGQSAQFFQNIYTTTNEEYALFYQGMSLLNADQIQKADDLFETHSWSENYIYKVNWYLALSKLKQNQTQEAKELLLKNINSGNYKVEEAEELLDKLD